MAADWREHVVNMARQAVAGFTPAPMVTVPAPTPFSGPLSLQPQFDPFEILPEGAAAKLRALRQRSADAHRLVPEFSQISEASMARIEATNALKRLVAHPSENGFGLKNDGSDRRVVEAQRQLDKAADDFRRLQELRELRTQAWQTASAALSNTEAWLRHGMPSGGVTLQDFEAEPPKLAKGEAGLLDALENRRRRVRELKADLARISAAPFPSSHAKAQMREIVEQLATRGAPDVANLVELDREIIWPMLSVQSEVYNAQPGATAFAQTPDTSHCSHGCSRIS